ncbi:VirB3 family type IV secretion system protein [Steroidobacter sp. S1-65]|uniref:VirB3 family type IV secretion system protein n=1 Tax=Steroidobacter gossypii TaxID=2805490 RepID=A0ABS1WXU1_9GAMM|nr:VirB3 family type IV secretion system protein [Steroidobacter gossypii]MBM0105796.1 VirB3 family type IV secretion system protein [Steroidobacter gossypii]
MSGRNEGLVADVLFVAVTRPPTRWGVAYEALLMNLIITMQAFILTKNLVMLLIAAPIHGLCALLCARDPRIFSLLILAARTRVLAAFTTLRHWSASSYSPLRIDLPNRAGVRRRSMEPIVAHGLRRPPR